MSDFHWSVGVTTAPRATSTIVETLRSIEAAGWQDPFVFAEAATEPFGWGVTAFHEGTPGPWLNFLFGLEKLLNLRPQADACVMFQDDIQVTAGLRAWLERSPWPCHPARIGVMSLYCASLHAADQQCWRAMPATRLPREASGALAYVFTPVAARALLRHYARRGVGRNRTDFWVGKWCLEANLLYLQPTPSFVKHTGLTSTQRQRDLSNPVVAAHEAKHRQCREFVDDARNLPEQLVLV